MRVSTGLLLTTCLLMAACGQPFPGSPTRSLPLLTPLITLAPTLTPSPTIEILSPTAAVSTAALTPRPRPTSLPPDVSPAPTPSPTACPNPWFTSVPAITCPDAPAHKTEAAAQPFEHGWMIWLKTGGQYLILIDEGGFEQAADPLTITGDTSGNYSPPDGLFAPVSGFGLVWRGDVSQSAGRNYPQRLGWASEAEFGFEAIIQCSHGPTPHWSCYLSGPRGGLIGYGTPGTWFYSLTG